MKIAIQIIIMVLGVAALTCGISKMSLETTTMILPAWLIITIVSSGVCAISVGIGLLAKHLLNSDWHQLTFASIIIIIIVGIYSTIEYKPTLKIFVSPEYAGEVKLFVSRDAVEKYDITVNNFGIGYISINDFDKGFYPKIVKGHTDISKKIMEYRKGTSLNSLSDSYSFKYLSFDIPGDSNALTDNIDDLLRIGAIDTMLLPRRNLVKSRE
jgi:hypothetical protein